MPILIALYLLLAACSAEKPASIERIEGVRVFMHTPSEYSVLKPDGFLWTRSSERRTTRLVFGRETALECWRKQVTVNSWCDDSLIVHVGSELLFGGEHAPKREPQRTIPLP